MRKIAFFNNKGGVGKTTLVYHVAWMLSKLGIRTVAIDLDPQSNLTSMFLTPGRLEEIFEQDLPLTLLSSIKPVVAGDPYVSVHIERINNNLGLVIGDLALSSYEDLLSDAWLKCLGRNNDHEFKKTSIFHTIVNDAARQFDAELVLLDVGPNLGAINRAVTISSDYVILPVASDLFSLQGIKNLGVTLSAWRNDWNDRLSRRPPAATFEIPSSNFLPAGYIIMQYTSKQSRPVKSYLRWANRIPTFYSQYVLNQTSESQTVEEDGHCIALLKHYHSLAPMAMEAHKPMFLLKPADGAIGAHTYAVQACYEDFEKLTQEILNRCP
jgi:cellulose biosynthesis protein BcsQ